MVKEQYKVTGGDESYTYPSLIIPIIDYIKSWQKHKDKTKVTLWCPFSTEKDIAYKDFVVCASNYPKILREAGFNVITSHIVTGQNFFDYAPKEHWDIMIDNPPFKNKKQFFERALSFNKPFALVTTMSWLNDGGLYSLFKDTQMQLLMPDKRSKFFNNTGCIGKRPSFKAGYICYDFLVNGDISWFTLDRTLEKDADDNT